MSFYDNYLRLCAEHGETPSGAAAAIGLSNAAATGWKKGKIPSDLTLSKLAEHFGVSVADLTAEKEEQRGTNTVTDADLKFALFGGDGEITDAMFEEVKRFAAFVKQREQEKEAKKD